MRSFCPAQHFGSPPPLRRWRSLFGEAAVRRVHVGGIVDSQFPGPVRDALLAEGLAEEQRRFPQPRHDHFWHSWQTRLEACTMADATVVPALLSRTGRPSSRHRPTRAICVSTRVNSWASLSLRFECVAAVLWGSTASSNTEAIGRITQAGCAQKEAWCTVPFLSRSRELPFPEGCGTGKAFPCTCGR